MSSFPEAKSYDSFVQGYRFLRFMHWFIIRIQTRRHVLKDIVESHNGIVLCGLIDC